MQASGTHRHTIDLRDHNPRAKRTPSVWSHLPSLGPMNTAEAVQDLYARDEVEVMQ